MKHYYLWLLACLLAAPVSAAQLRAGAARACITPQIGIAMNGGAQGVRIPQFCAGAGGGRLSLPLPNNQDAL